MDRTLVSALQRGHDMAERQADFHENPRKRVEFYFDYGSPTSYLAYTQIEKIAKRNSAAVDYKPVLLGGVLSATGNRPPTDIAAKRKWMIGDLECFAKHYGVSFRWNPKFRSTHLR